MVFAREARECCAWGVERLSGNDKPEASGDRANRSVAKSDAREKRTKKIRKSSVEVGRALRSVYDDTLHEDVPADFLALLGKLE